MILRQVQNEVLASGKWSNGIEPLLALYAAMLQQTLQVQSHRRWFYRSVLASSSVWKLLGARDLQIRHLSL